MRALLLGVVLVGCTPPPCGEVLLDNVQSNSEIEAYRRADGRIGLIEICTEDYGAFMLERSDMKLTKLVLDADVEGDPTSEGGYAVTGVILPAASVAFWDANLVKGAVLGIDRLAGSGLHKSTSAGGDYTVYLLTKGTVEVLDGPLNRREEKLLDEVRWHEEWKLRWDLEFGNGAQRWTGEDLVKRSQGSTAGSETHVPPDPKP